MAWAARGPTFRVRRTLWTYQGIEASRYILGDSLRSGSTTTSKKMYVSMDLDARRTGIRTPYADSRWRHLP
jgi:hypothetical protein